jgi:putative peptide zinc metalloprotease protein
LSALARPRRLAAAARPEETARILAAKHGPPDERPALRKDLGILRQVQMGEVMWVVKNPATSKYFQFKDFQWQLIRLFDGMRTRTEILETINRHMGSHPIKLETVLEYEEFLRSRELIELTPAELSLTLLDKFRSLRDKRVDEKQEGFNIFFIMFHVLDPNRFLDKTVKYLRWLWSPPVAIATVVASVWTAFIFSQHWSQIWSQTMDLYHFLGKPLPDIIQFFLILCTIGGIHEFAHAYAVKMYGGEVHDVGLALFYFTPAFYCDTSDSFLFANRFKRLWVTVAGVYSEVMICSIATALWVASYPDTLLHALAYKTMLFTGVSAVFFNINPLIKVDGYYALSSLLQMPELREAAWHQVGAWFQKNILRLPVEAAPTTRRKLRIYWIYGVLSMTYTATVMLFIYRLFNNFYTKYFPDVGIVFLIVTLWVVFRKKTRTLIRVSKMAYLDKKELLMSPRSRLPLATTAAVILLLVAIPWTRRTISAEASLKPVDEVTLQAPEDGVVTEVLVHEGDLVEPGQPLLRMGSAAIDAETARSAQQQEFHTRKASLLRASANAPMMFESESRAAAAQTALESARSRQGFLTIRSPMKGRVLTPRMGDLEGRNVAASFPLVRIGDCRRMAAELAVSERLLEYLSPGSVVTAKVETRPLKSYPGTVAAISPATQAQPATAAAGRDPVLPSALPDRFVALAVFDNGDGSLLPGAAAKVKIHARRASYFSRAFSVVWRWLRAILW